MTLSMAQKGERLEVQRITGKDETKNFLGNLGFVEGAPISVVSKMNGNIIINVKETRIALDKSLTNRIIVKEESI